MVSNMKERALVIVGFVAVKKERIIMNICFSGREDYQNWQWSRKKIKFKSGDQFNLKVHKEKGKFVY